MLSMMVLSIQITGNSSCLFILNKNIGGYTSNSSPTIHDVIFVLAPVILIISAPLAVKLC
jgi:hypothetical protein